MIVLGYTITLICGSQNRLPYITVTIIHVSGLDPSSMSRRKPTPFPSPHIRYFIPFFQHFQLDIPT